MSQHAADASLMGIPIEIRHIIFAYAAARNVKPKKVLRYWFEKMELIDIIAKLPNDGSEIWTIPRFNASDDDYKLYENDSGSDLEPPLDSDDDEESDEDEDQDEIDTDEEEAEDEHNEDEHDLDENDDEVQVDEAELDGTDQDMLDSGGNGNEATAVPHASTTAVDEDDVMGGTDDEQERVEAEGEEVTLDEGDQHADHDEDAEGEIDESLAEGGVNTAAPPQQDAPAPPRAPPVAPHRKWEHIPKFFRITQCPPPTYLSLICKQLRTEIKDWFYNVAVLQIDATASFAHMSFFELALGQLAEAAFSPMENIKKADVTFVWDTTWICSEQTGFAAAVFPVFLNTRAEYVLKILQQAPQLEQLIIHWHDTAQDDGAKDTMNQALEPFILNLTGVETKIEEHYIAADAKPHARSIAGKRRVEFQGIMDTKREAF